MLAWPGKNIATLWIIGICGNSYMYYYYYNNNSVPHWLCMCLRHLCCMFFTIIGGTSLYFDSIFLVYWFYSTCSQLRLGSPRHLPPALILGLQSFGPSHWLQSKVLCVIIMRLWALCVPNASDWDSSGPKSPLLTSFLFFKFNLIFKNLFMPSSHMVRETQLSPWQDPSILTPPHAALPSPSHCMTTCLWSHLKDGSWSKQ